MAYVTPPREADQAELWEACWAGDKAARSELIETNLQYVEIVVRKMFRGLPSHVDLDDVRSYGKLGLIRAVDLFDPAHRGGFGTYAVIRIRGMVLDELGRGSVDWAPRSLRRREREVARAREELSAECGRTVTEEEIGRRLGKDGCYVRQVLVEVSHSTFKSIQEAEISDAGGGDYVMEVADAGPAPEDSAIMSLTRERVQEWLLGLPTESQKIMALYYYYELTFTEIARRLDLPSTYVSQQHTRLILRLGQILREVLDLAGT